MKSVCLLVWCGTVFLDLYGTVLCLDLYGTVWYHTVFLDLYGTVCRALLPYRLFAY